MPGGLVRGVKGRQGYLYDDGIYWALCFFVDVDHPGSGSVPLPGIVTKMSKTPGEIESPAPKAGQHNEEIFSQVLGLSMEEISELKEKKVV